jgi:valyl-tRNA synthetase
VDTAFDVAQIKIGRRLAIKILNAGRFVLGFEPPAGHGDGSGLPPSEPIDRAMLRRLATVVERCTTALDGYDHAAAVEQAERFFWFFCDDYLELVKARAYGEHGPEAASSAVATLRLGLSVVLRLLAPFLPFVTEEVWSWWQGGSVHRAAWPDAGDLRGLAGPADEAVIEAAVAAITAIRKAKSQAQLRMKDPVPLLILTAAQQSIDALAAASRDVKSAGRVAQIELRSADGAEPIHDVVV